MVQELIPKILTFDFRKMPMKTGTIGPEPTVEEVCSVLGSDEVKSSGGAVHGAAR